MPHFTNSRIEIIQKKVVPYRIGIQPQTAQIMHTYLFTAYRSFFRIGKLGKLIPEVDKQMLVGQNDAQRINADRSCYTHYLHGSVLTKRGLSCKGAYHLKKTGPLSAFLFLAFR